MTHNTTMVRYFIISIHALLAESDRPPHLRRDALQHFYPRSPCGERPELVKLYQHEKGISIHALLAESDLAQRLCRLVHIVISIHALLAESDIVPLPRRSSRLQFLSTLSLRRATVGLKESSGFFRYFYPRSPCGERLTLMHAAQAGNAISIHALLAESDQCPFRSGLHLSISIHALLAESDKRFCMFIFSALQFLSTLSLRRATIIPVIVRLAILKISIHALLAESDGSCCSACC